MQDGFPEAEVDGYRPLVATMSNHPKDRHVLAAAIYGGAGVLVTFNLGDFPAATTSSFELDARGADDFLLDLLDLSPRRTIAALSAQVNAYTRQPDSVPSLLAVLERCGVPAFAAEARRHLT